MSKILIALYILTTSSALIVLKLGSKTGAPLKFASGRPELNLSAYTLIGIMLYGISFLLYTYLISKYELGYIIPVTTAFVYIFIFTASYFIFNEAFTAFKVLGICLIFGGIVFLNLNK